MLNHPNIALVDPIIRQIAAAQNVDPALVKAVMAVESGFNPSAVSPKGAIGLMQVIPDTGVRFGIAADKRRSVEQKLTDPRLNISAGVRYLSWLQGQFPNNLELVLAAYNAGEGAVARYNNQIPPFPETRQYVSTVMEFYRIYQPSGVAVVRTGSHAGRVKMVIGGRRNMPE
ncbi:Soluble lytic murein transglycosylase precursor [compost metagenome]